MKKKIWLLWLIALVGIILIGGSLSAGLFDEQPVADINDILRTIRLCPAVPGTYLVVGVIYNPNIDRYVVFVLERRKKSDRLYSRLYNTKGGATTNFRKVIDFNSWVGYMDVVFNPRDNLFFLVGGDNYFSEINGAVFSGDGLLIGGEEDYIQIKPDTGSGSAIFPQVNWIETTNQYTVHWVHYDWQNPDNYVNGQYLSLLNGDFSFAVKKRKVRQQSMRNYLHYAKVLPLDDGLLWTSGEDGPGARNRPVVWFTNFRGKIRYDIPYSSGGIIHPSGAGDGHGLVTAVYNAADDNFLLHWNEANSPWNSEQIYAVNRYRIMERSGKFLGPWQEVPKKSPFQTAGVIVHNSVENRYFCVFPEYNRHIPKEYKYQVGGKLWGVYMDNMGNLEAKNGIKKWAPIPLTDLYTNKLYELEFNGMTFNYDRNEYLNFYSIYNTANNTYRCWGSIFQ
ncbi:MAG: hypothetical protein JXB23_15545 [Candidatus Aminicenantes bacterium]|nr:hypothetical protein [Candidatus Aminicenantes bacterium]